MSGRWFRMYDDALDDPKVQRLSPSLFKAWVNMLMLASKGGGKLPPVDDIAFRLRLSVQDAQQFVDELILCGLLDVMHDKSISPHNWSGRQMASDSSAERVRQHRAKKRAASTQNVTPCADVTLQKRDSNASDQNQSREEKIRNINNAQSESAAARERATKPSTRGVLTEHGFFNRAGSSDPQSDLPLDVRRILKLADGWGIDADRLLTVFCKSNAAKPAAYMASLVESELSVRLPSFSPSVLRAAIAGGVHPQQLITNALLDERAA